MKVHCSLVRVVAPVGDVVTLADAKAFLRVDGSDEDSLIGGLLETAVAKFDGYDGCLGRALLSQTWRATFSAFASHLQLAVPPLISVDAISYFDRAGAAQTLAVDDFYLQPSEPAVLIARGALPDTQCRPDAVSIEFTAGYPTAAEIPAPIRTAILQTLGTLYEHRETLAFGSGDFRDAPASGLSLCDSYRVWSF